MVRRIKLVGLIAAALVIILPSFAVAQDINFSVFPAEVHIDNLPSGEAAEFELTIHNKEETAHNFTIATFQPPQEQRRAGRAEFPDDSWISFSSQEIEVAAKSEADVTVTVAIPRERDWAGESWETAARSNAGLVVGIIVGIVLLGFGGYYYFRHKAVPE